MSSPEQAIERVPVHHRERIHNALARTRRPAKNGAPEDSTFHRPEAPEAWELASAGQNLAAGGRARLIYCVAAVWKDLWASVRAYYLTFRSPNPYREKNKCRSRSPG